MSIGDELVSIRGIAGGGDGVGTLADGRTVFVPRTAPGDLIRIELVREHSSFVRGRLSELIRSGPNRIEPPCSHYTRDNCGACQLQHLDHGSQRAARRTIVGDALRRIAHLAIDDPIMHGEGPDFGYRSQMTMTVGRGRIGFHRYDLPNHIADIHDCIVARPGLRSLLKEVRAARALLPAGCKRLVLREAADGSRHLVVVTRRGAQWQDPHSLVERLADDVQLWWQPDGLAVSAVPPGVPRASEATSFAQGNPPVAAQVRAAALESIGEVAGRVVWDLYAGLGQSTTLLHQRGAIVESVELDPVAVEHAIASGPDGVRRCQGDVAGVIPKLTPPFRVLTNPPRTGMEAAVVELLLKCGADRIVYISCDPATLARDLKRLASGYQLGEVTAWDQFPQTAHVESIAVLERA